jgi:hypothetical protein
MSSRSRAKSAHDNAMSSRNGATSRVIGAMSMAIDGMSTSIGAMSSRSDATSEVGAATARLAGAMERRGPSIATNGGGTKALSLSIERQARAIAKKSLAIESRRNTEKAHLSVNEDLEHERRVPGRNSYGSDQISPGDPIWGAGRTRYKFGRKGFPFSQTYPLGRLSGSKKSAGRVNAAKVH